MNRIIVIGAGPAGLMAAGCASSMGANTLVLEKKPLPGLKLRITGKGRCNITNIAPVEEFITHLNNGRFLRQAFARFFSSDLIALLNKYGVETVVERGGRVFPVSEKAQDVADALIAYAQEKATIKTRSHVQRVLINNNKVIGVETYQGTISADAVIIATGGKSYPATGSTGDGYEMAASAGHTIIPVRPALVPLETAGDVAGQLEGLSLRNVQVTLLVEDKTSCQLFGEMVFTSFGMSGPVVLQLSRQAVDALQAGKKVEISFDLKPALDRTKLDVRLLRDLDEHGKTIYRNLLKQLLPRSLIPVCVQATGIAHDKVGHQITADERKRLLAWLKDFRFTVTGHRGFEEAIVTAGGVSVKEVYPKTMASRLINGLFFAGEVLDLDADTGGYNLQTAFSTGWLAGKSASEMLSSISS
ncbi:MAG: NAD(P)/FAD-dependent oxidoreductase [Anaerolineales bacterium]|nr:NAD(P)/FAD-dependent oxidoreductase [Anaerolineales bacterium]